MSERGDPQTCPQAAGGRAPDVFTRGGWVPMREYREDQEVDFAIVGTGAGGATLAAKLAEAGFSIVSFDAGPFWRPLEDFASDETEQNKLYWTQDRISVGDNPIEFGANNSGCSVGGSTVHFQMVTLRFRPEWFASKSKLGYGRDWPVDWKEMWRYYDEVEDALKISGPVRYPWGPHRAAAIPTASMRSTPRAWCSPKAPKRLACNGAQRRSRLYPRRAGARPPCVYRGFCKIGCSTNAKQSALNTYIPRALAAGAEIRDLAMVGADRDRQERTRDGRRLPPRRANGGGRRAKNVIVAGYAIETPRLLLHSACAKYPDGLANSIGLVGKCFMAHSNHAVWGVMQDEIRWYKGPPSMAVCEHWNYEDKAKDFVGGYAFMSQGPLPGDHAKSLVSQHRHVRHGIAPAYGAVQSHGRA